MVYFNHIKVYLRNAINRSEFGHAAPINDDVKEKRKKLQMEVITETVHKYPDVLRDVETLLQSCKFDKLTADK